MIKLRRLHEAKQFPTLSKKGLSAANIAEQIYIDFTLKTWEHSVLQDESSPTRNHAPLVNEYKQKAKEVITN